MLGYISIPLLFDISGSEFLLIMLFVLIFFGSKNIPDLARGLGRGYRQVKDAANSIKSEIQSGSNDVKKSISNPIDKHIKDIDKEVKKDMDDINKDIEDGLK